MEKNAEEEQKMSLKINTQSQAAAMYLDENFNNYKTLSYSELVFTSKTPDKNYAPYTLNLNLKWN